MGCWISGFALPWLPMIQAAFLLAHPLAAAGLDVPKDCRVEAGTTHTVARTAEGDTLVLEDGREVRLAGMLVPRASDIGAVIWQRETEATKALETLAAGHTVTLHFGGRRIDRYGRLLAQAVVMRAGETVWVQGRMVEFGMARAVPLTGTETCLAGLIRLEGTARAASLGLWKAPAYRIRDATRPGDLVPLGASFQIVEGRIASVGSARGRVYLNFGDDRRRDLSVSLPRKEATSLLADTTNHRDLAERLVRVRGWLGLAGGPTIEAATAVQVELIDGLTISRPRRPWSREAASR